MVHFLVEILDFLNSILFYFKHMVEILVGHSYMYIIKLYLRYDTETNKVGIEYTTKQYLELIEKYKKILAILLAGIDRGPVLFLEF